MHPNSLNAYIEKIDTLTGRREQVFKVIELHGAMTDRQILKRLKLADMNMVRPRITELIDMKLLIEVGNERDPATGVRVRIVDLKHRKHLDARKQLRLI